jgi:vacuolar-type H+-ATPase subunit E/Vma4
MFSKTTETSTVVPQEEIVETHKVAVTSNTDEITPHEDALLADAQTLMRDKLIEKYQVRLDKVMEQLTKKLSGVPADTQRQVLTEVQLNISKKRALVLAKKNIDPMKQEITIAILDHISLRIEGMIQQSAQTTTTTLI